MRMGWLIAFSTSMYLEQEVPSSVWLLLQIKILIPQPDNYNKTVSSKIRFIMQIKSVQSVILNTKQGIYEPVNLSIVALQSPPFLLPEINKQLPAIASSILCQSKKQHEHIKYPHTYLYYT